MVNEKKTIVGYVALHSSMTMFCEEGACIVSENQSALNRLLKSSGHHPAEFQKRKTPLSAIIEGLASGGTYALDIASFRAFRKSAESNNFKFGHELKKSVVDGTEYYYVYPHTP